MNLQSYKFIKLNSEELWKKELRLILNRDIHEKGLGCCINNTHIKVGDVHLGKFYEAQFLFGNAYWISIFSNALKKEIVSQGYNNDKLLIVGYETYIEPMLLQLKELLIKENILVDFCIYEEPKYVMKDKKSSVRLRFGANVDINEYDNIVLVCGISSTLSTFCQMVSKISCEKKTSIYDEIKNVKCFSIIQVLPEELQSPINNVYFFESSDNYDNALFYIPNDNTIKRNFVKKQPLKIEAKYLIDIFCEWQLAKNCKWCFDDSFERPIITTNETSVIPVQMIGKSVSIENKRQETDILPQIDFFTRDTSDNFIYSNYLYYNHVERDSHHFQYYIRTNSLLKYIVNDYSENKKLNTFCTYVSSKLFTQPDEDRIDVIVAPIHYSNEHFLNVISQKVFNNNAEIIIFDPQKEFRSNFETKFSNYAYVLEAITSKALEKIYFHYIDDQNITGNTFYKAKSLVSSLIRNSIGSDCINGSYERVVVFESIITLIDRNSKSTKQNYITDLDKYFSLIDISVPSLRNHGDSCYLCLKSNDAEQIKKKTALWQMENYWEEKEVYHRIKTLDETKKLKEEESLEIKQRKFRRFYCENLIWKSLKSNWDSDSIIYKELLRIISSELKIHKRTEQYEYLISFIKVISKPYLYYRENIKKAVHAIMLYSIHILNQNPHIVPVSILHILKNIPYGNHKKAYSEIECLTQNITKHQMCKGYEIQKYYLYIMLLSRICAINSNYLIKYDNIEKSFNLYDTLFPNESDARNMNIKHISNYICPLIKLLTNGISGYYKARHLDTELENANILPKHKEIIQKIYIENLEAEEEKIKDENEIESKECLSSNATTRNKYTNILEESIYEDTIELIIKFKNTDNFFIISKNASDTTYNFDSELINTVLNKNPEFYIHSECVFVKCCDFNDGSTAYIIIHCSINNDDNKLDIKKLKSVRSILKHRHEIYVELAKDMASGSLKELYQDDKWLEMLSQPKAISHGQSEDIKEHLSVLEEKFQLFSQHGQLLNNKFCNIISDLTLFGNLLISFFHSSKIAEERGTCYTFANELKFTTIKYISKPDIFSYENVVDENGINFEKYDNSLIKEDIYDLFLSRFDLYIMCLKDMGVNFEFINDITEINNGILSLDLSDRNLIWIPITIIHILVRNAIQHGDCQEPISIIFKRNNNAFDLIVKNRLADEQNLSKNGITKQALTYAFENSQYKLTFSNDETSTYYIVCISNFFNGGSQ